jgi:CheY-like chemotaxis protein
VSGPLAGRRLLVVDENADLAEVVADAASRLGAAVERLDGGRAALAALARTRFDAAVLDLPLGEVRGSDVLAALRRAGVPAIAVSGVYRGPRAAEEVRRLGAAEFFEKPFPVEALVAAVGRLLGRAVPALGEARDEVTGSTPLQEDPVEAVPTFGLDEAPTPAVAGSGTHFGLAAPLPGDAGRLATPPSEEPLQRSGDLARTTVPRILVALHVAQGTGALTIGRGSIRKIVVVERGAVVYAASNVAAERFGAVCVRRGIVTPERLEALRRNRPEARTATLLEDAGLLAPARRAELIAGQIRAIVWSTFEWREGSYEFHLARPPEGRLPVVLPVGDLVLEGMLRTATLPRLREDLAAELHLAPAPDPAFELYALGLRPGEAHLLSLADGTKSVADLVRLSDLPERDALAFLQACRMMRVLDEVDRVLASTRRIGFM